MYWLRMELISVDSFELVNLRCYLGNQRSDWRHVIFLAHIGYETGLGLGMAPHEFGTYSLVD